MHIDPSHPRAVSLMTREKLVRGVKLGLTSTAGLLAHGRGEAFDYLLGEKTHDFAIKAIDAAAAYLLCAKHPVLSINGNAAALAPKEFITLSQILDCHIEVNLFHYTNERANKIRSYLIKLGSKRILPVASKEKVVLPGIASPRKKVHPEGIARCDVILVPLEDGDRCAALISLGKKVITIDLNPLSRTARQASVTIVDNIIRAMPLLNKTVQEFKVKPKEYLSGIIRNYDNSKILSCALTVIIKRLNGIAGSDK